MLTKLDDLNFSNPKSQELADRPNLSVLEELAKAFEPRIKEERLLVKQLLVHAFSAYTLSPINAVLKDPPGTGKTFAIEEVLRAFPDEDVVSLMYASPTAFFHERGLLLFDDDSGKPFDALVELERLREHLKEEKDKDKRLQIKENIRELRSRIYTKLELSNKILTFNDSIKWQLFLNSKQILSHDKWILETRITDADLHVQRLRLEGWPAVIIATANSSDEFRRDFAELIQRAKVLNTSSTRLKFIRAKQLSGDRRGLPPSLLAGVQGDVEFEKLKERVRLIRDRILNLKEAVLAQGYNPETFKSLIYNPFRTKLAEDTPSDSPDVMRAFNLFIEYVQVVTLINSEQRAYVELDGLRFPVTTVQDILEASELCADVFDQSVNKRALLFLREVIVPAYNELEKKGVHTGLTVSLCQGWHRDHRIEGLPAKLPKQTLSDYLRGLDAWGLIEVRTDPNDKRAIVLSPTAADSPKSIIRTTSDYLEALADAALHDIKILSEKRKISPDGGRFTPSNFDGPNNSTGVKQGGLGLILPNSETNSSEMVRKSPPDYSPDDETKRSEMVRTTPPDTDASSFRCPDSAVCGYQGVFLGKEAYERHREEFHKGGTTKA